MEKKDLKQMLEKMLTDTTSTERRGVPYPAPILTINHNSITWELVDRNDRNTKERTPLNQEISVATLKSFLQSKVFSSAGLLVALSQIVLPSERRYMVNVLDGSPWNESDFGNNIVINSWLVPVIILPNFQKAIWEIKRTSLKAVINFIQESNLRNINGLILRMKLLKRKEGTMKSWAEPKIVEFKQLKEADDKLIEAGLNFYAEFEEFRKQFNLQYLSLNGDELEEL